MTTYEGVRQGGVEPEFFSLSYHGPIAEGKEEWAYKIFSKEVISDEWLNKMFDNQVTWVHRKEVSIRAYLAIISVDAYVLT